MFVLGCSHFWSTSATLGALISSLKRGFVPKHKWTPKAGQRDRRKAIPWGGDGCAAGLCLAQGIHRSVGMLSN